MRLKHTILFLGVLLGMAACRGSGPDELVKEVRVQPLYGTGILNWSVKQSDTVVLVQTAAVPETGLFLLVSPPAGHILKLLESNENDNLLFMQVAGASGTELGAVAIDRSGDLSLNISFEISSEAPPKQASLFEDAYRVDELVVVPSAQDDFVTLNWVEKNIGDYDFNGEVNAADLVPLSQHLGEKDFRGSTAANTTALYYIDGDENNEINIADIVPIARNYKNTIAGYFINKNGKLILDNEGTQPILYSRDPANEFIINDAPVFFQVSLAGSFEDQYSVLPVTEEGSVQSESIVFDGAELQASFYIEDAALQDGLEFFNLIGDGSILSGSSPSELQNGIYCIMRVIEPIDIVNGLNDPITWFIPANWDTTPASADEGIRQQQHGFRFEKLKRPDSSDNAPRPYQLEVLFAPAVDLITGAPRSYSGKSVPNSFYYRLAVPVFIPEGRRTVQADLGLDIVPAESGPGYDIILHNHQYQTGAEFDNSLMRLVMQQDAESGKCTGLVSRVFDPDADRRYTGVDFRFSPQFVDSNCDGISDQLQLRLITLADEEYYDQSPFPLTLRGTPILYDPLTGSQTVEDIYRIISSSLEVFYAGQRTMQLSELTRLNWIVHDDDGVHPVELDPKFLDGLGNNAELEIKVSLMDGIKLEQNDLSQLYWVDSQTVTLDLTSAN
jgi:hypothetical protein